MHPGRDCLHRHGQQSERWPRSTGISHSGLKSHVGQYSICHQRHDTPMWYVSWATQAHSSCHLETQSIWPKPRPITFICAGHTKTHGCKVRLAWPTETGGNMGQGLHSLPSLQDTTVHQGHTGDIPGNPSSLWPQPCGFGRPSSTLKGVHWPAHSYWLIHPLAWNHSTFQHNCCYLCIGVSHSLDSLVWGSPGYIIRQGVAIHDTALDINRTAVGHQVAPYYNLPPKG